MAAGNANFSTTPEVEIIKSKMASQTGKGNDFKHTGSINNF